jgi:hypothetical protein
MSNLDKRLALARGGGVQTNQVPPHKYFGALFGLELTEQLWLRLFAGDRGACVGYERFGRADWQQTFYGFLSPYTERLFLVRSIVETHSPVFATRRLCLECAKAVRFEIDGFLRELEVWQGWMGRGMENDLS